MANDSEKRFEAVMEKLFQEPPKSSNPNPRDPSSSRSSLGSNGAGAKSSRGKKRPLVSSTSLLALSRGSSVGQLQNSAGVACRPWDRDDLFRRLATFKSMTWFAKPQAASRVNCARRGWINIDMDTLSCESCGARLLFSTPSSWDQQQVEKAALVFSLKLDTGHKLLCPWVDNICDEKLADFPPKLTVVLQEEYKKRCSVLLHLTALPRISASAIDSMDSPELQQFLVGPSGMEKNSSTDASNYYQAQKLISLCGWEPHSLQYIVDCDIGKEVSSDTGNLAHPSQLAADGLNLSVVTCPSDKNIEEYYNAQAAERALFEPSSVALKCRLCGSTVGLWAFSSIQRPMEFLRLVGYTAVDENHAVGKGATERFTTSTSSNLSLTIAGGPPPAKQNYRSTISLPVVGRILRARLSTNSLVSEGQEMRMIELNIKDYEANQIGAIDHNNDNQPEDVQVVRGGLTSDNELKENEENTKTGDVVVLEHDRSQIGGASGSGLGETEMTVSTRSSETNAGMVSEVAVSKPSDQQGDVQHGDGEGSRALVVYGTGHSSLAKIPEQACEQKSMVFDPIRQHKALCPWITSSGKSLPGWKQTLTAILQQKEFSGDTLPEKAPSSIIEVDDPVESIRQLFNTPPAKRMKRARGI